MRKIPDDLRAELAADTGRRDEKIDWHHALIFGGKQVNESWAILPVARSLHLKADYPAIKEKLNWVMLNRATDEQLRPYCKLIDYVRMREQLNAKYGVPSVPKPLVSIAA